MIFQHQQLIPLAADIFRAAGCSADEALRVATHLVDSNLVGHDSHGVIRIPSYVQWLAAGKVFAGKSIAVVQDSAALVVVDGQFGLGQTIGEQATQLGIDRAAQHGVSVIALRNAGHLGRIGDWAEQAAAAGMVSLHFVNTSGAGMLVAPFGGIDRRLSANPLAAGVPTGRGAPLILDMSACTIAEGKIRVALNSGKALPEGCVIDHAGHPTTDPKLFYADPPGSILPIAGHKGSGLSVMIEMFAGALTGGSCSSPEHMWRVANGMLSIYVDPLRLSELHAFYAEVQRFIDWVKSSRTLSENGEILVPGEIEQRIKGHRLEHGIELDDVTWGQICATCRELGVTHEFPEPAASSGAANIVMPGCEPKK